VWVCVGVWGPWEVGGGNKNLTRAVPLHPQAHPAAGADGGSDVTDEDSGGTADAAAAQVQTQTVGSDADSANGEVTLLGETSEGSTPVGRRRRKLPVPRVTTAKGNHSTDSASGASVDTFAVNTTQRHEGEMQHRASTAASSQPLHSQPHPAASPEEALPPTPNAQGVEIVEILVTTEQRQARDFASLAVKSLADVGLHAGLTVLRPWQRSNVPAVLDALTSSGIKYVSLFLNFNGASGVCGDGGSGGGGVVGLGPAR
jgi:hypothetical protein